MYQLGTPWSNSNDDANCLGTLFMHSLGVFYILAPECSNRFMTDLGPMLGYGFAYNFEWQIMF